MHVKPYHAAGDVNGHHVEAALLHPAGGHDQSMASMLMPSQHTAYLQFQKCNCPRISPPLLPCTTQAAYHRLANSTYKVTQLNRGLYGTAP
jgi:hypothetical protein